MDNKGQSESEAVILAVIAMSLLLTIIVFNSFKNQELEFTSEFYKKAAFCRDLSSAINRMEWAEGNEEITFNSEYDFNITGKNIAVEGYSCEFWGSARDAQINKGSVKLSEEGGFVVVQ